MNHKERMLAGLPYKAWMDGLPQEQMKTKKKLHAYNTCRPDKIGKLRRMLAEIVGECGPNVNVLPPFHCDYGKNIELGNHVFINYNCVMLDICRIKVGDNTLMGPNVCLTTAGHPIHPLSRRSGYEYGAPITIGHDVWLGANVVVNPGVTIGDGSVIGSGSVVTKDIPANVVAVGNPCRVLRPIADEDRKFYFKDKEFDVTDY